MWCGAQVAVIVPAYCEERLIGTTLDSIPEFVDAVYAVDDASWDGTREAILAARRKARRVRYLAHPSNRGVGAAIVTGYQRAVSDGADVLAVMAGDNQMHPDDLEALLEPVVQGHADYAKGNRIDHPLAAAMPLERRIAGRALAALTSAVTGLSVSDSQCGYTALSALAAQRLPLTALWPGFGYPNDLLGMLAEHGMRVVDVPVRPVYADERSGVRPWHVGTICGLLARRWWRARERGGQASMARSTISSAQRSA